MSRNLLRGAANGAQLTVDGKSGPATTDALKSYQSAHQLKPTGHVDSATMKALGLGRTTPRCADDQRSVAPVALVTSIGRRE